MRSILKRAVMNLYCRGCFPASFVRAAFAAFRLHRQ